MKARKERKGIPATGKGAQAKDEWRRPSAHCHGKSTRKRPDGTATKGSKSVSRGSLHIFKHLKVKGETEG